MQGGGGYILPDIFDSLYGSRKKTWKPASWLSFLTIGILWSFVNSSSKKQTEAPEFNTTSVLSLWEPRWSGMVKQWEGWAERKGPWLSWCEESSCTVPIVAGLLRFLTANYLM